MHYYFFTDTSYLQFFGDDFLRLLILRYVFCYVVLQLHRGFKGRQYRPRCHPPLPEAELLEHPSLQHLVLDLAAHLEVRTHFVENHEIDWSRAPRRGNNSPVRSIVRFTLLLAIALVVGERAIQFFWTFISIWYANISCEMTRKRFTFCRFLYNSNRFLLLPEYFWTHLKLTTRSSTVLMID